MHLHRSDVLQGKAGPSIASECGLLLPIMEGEKTGASCAGIFSQGWSAASVHFNAASIRNREGNRERFLGAIVEGLAVGQFKPVVETFIVRDSADGKINSAPVWFVWTANE
jgi:hypothetical protein